MAQDIIYMEELLPSSRCWTDVKHSPEKMEWSGPESRVWAALKQMMAAIMWGRKREVFQRQKCRVSNIIRASRTERRGSEMVTWKAPLRRFSAREKMNSSQLKTATRPPTSLRDAKSHLQTLLPDINILMFYDSSEKLSRVTSRRLTRTLFVLRALQCSGGKLDRVWWLSSISVSEDHIRS